MSRERESDTNENYRNTRQRIELTGDESEVDDTEEVNEEEEATNNAVIDSAVAEDIKDDGETPENNEDPTLTHEIDTEQYTAEQYEAMETRAILDSGADHTTIPESLARRLPWDITSQQQGRRSITLQYGNGATLQSTEEMQVGDYTIYIMPDTANQPLISLGEIVDEHNVITLRRNTATIEHETGVYALTFPREAIENQSTIRTRQWTVPVSILQQLTLLRQQHEREIRWTEGLEQSEETSIRDHQAALERMQRYRENQQQHENHDREERAQGRIPGLTIPGFISYYGPHSNENGTISQHTTVNQNIDEEDSSDVDEQLGTMFSARLHVTPRTDRERVIDLHERMAHAPEDVMCMAVDGLKPEWINTGVTAEMIHRVFYKEP